MTWATQGHSAFYHMGDALSSSIRGRDGAAEACRVHAPPPGARTATRPPPACPSMGWRPHPPCLHALLRGHHSHSRT